ncbi:MAG: hypothetical protein KC442_18705, partial [Thermomicrobiales bacterium]|nr:hypothetical protein [Thermomicrobiales bacterium]
RNAFITQWSDASEVGPDNPALQETVRRAEERGDLTVAGVSAGVSAGLVQSSQPAADIVHAIVREAEDLLRQRPRQLLGS